VRIVGGGIGRVGLAFESSSLRTRWVWIAEACVYLVRAGKGIWSSFCIGVVVGIGEG
jgi:hypothetical protein